MGGKSEIINKKNMEKLYYSGLDNVARIRKAEKNIEDRLTFLMSSGLKDENGVVYRQALNALSSAMKEVSKSTEKAAIYIDSKLNISKKSSKRIEEANLESIKQTHAKLRR